MGVQHTYLTLVECLDRKTLGQLRSNLIRRSKKKSLEELRLTQLIGPIIPTSINGGWCFVIHPDGSKEGFGTSNEAKKLRKCCHELANNHNNQYTYNSIPVISVRSVVWLEGHYSDNPRNWRNTFDYQID